MGSTRRSFTDEYKQEAVEYVLGGGRTIADVARNIGVHEMTLGKWVKKARDNGAPADSGEAPLQQSERAELKQLREENAHLHMQVAFAKSCDLVRERPAMIFAAIAGWVESEEFTVEFMCAELNVSRSGYYAWRGRAPSARSVRDTELSMLITVLHATSRGNAGVRRIHADLAQLQRRVSRKRVHQLMRTAGLQGRHPKAWKQTTISGHDPVPVPDLLGQDFTATAPNQRWVGDITYIKTWEGWAYTATVIDLFSRKIVGWACADHMRTSLVTDALTMAMTHRNPTGPVIFHSDRGTQYTSQEIVDYCEKNTITRSMGRTGTCYDNAVAESFFATYKKELIHTRPWDSVKTLRRETFDWVETYYNQIRRHSTIGYLTPSEYELRFIHTTKQAA